MTFTPKKILVPLDGSKNSERALATAVDIAKTSGGMLDIVRVVDPNIYAAYGGTSLNVTQFDEELAASSRDYLKGIGEQLTASGFTSFETHALRGNVKSVLARDYPTENHHDLIVVGATGMNAVGQVLVGSVTAFIVRHAGINVLVVKE
ncbi:universal stress protein [Furfurilactobacillus entadae]|uniref:universal stress protein n=1 Tax=Furfurilactobacillus entadae TaxID=2922307 RepID=UPI0035EC2329